MSDNVHPHQNHLDYYEQYYKKNYNTDKKKRSKEARAMQKVIDEIRKNESQAKVGQAIIEWKCYHCSGHMEGDSSTHPKLCNTTQCPLHKHRPISMEEKKEIKTQAQANLTPEELEAKHTKNAKKGEKARAGKGMGFKEALEGLSNVELTEDELQECDAKSPLKSKSISGLAKTAKHHQSEKMKKGKESEE